MNARTRASSAEAERSRISAETASTSGPSESSVRVGSPGARPEAWSPASSMKASICEKSTPICPSSEIPRSRSTYKESLSSSLRASRSGSPSPSSSLHACPKLPIASRKCARASSASVSARSSSTDARPRSYRASISGEACAPSSWYIVCSSARSAMRSSMSVSWASAPAGSKSSGSKSSSFMPRPRAA